MGYDVADGCHGYPVGWLYIFVANFELFTSKTKDLHPKLQLLSLEAIASVDGVYNWPEYVA